MASSPLVDRHPYGTVDTAIALAQPARFSRRAPIRIAVLLCLTLGGPAVADERGVDDRVANPSLDAALEQVCSASAAGMPALIAHYERHGSERPARYTLAREPTRVMHVYDEFAERYSLLRDGRVRAERYFDAERRSIAYAPIDVRATGDSRDWATRSGFRGLGIEPRLVDDERSACQSLQRRVLRIGERPMRIIWSAALQLPVEVAVPSAGGEMAWRLSHVSLEADSVAEPFEQRYGYRDIDFADIGDEPDDPFLRRMIELGFIERGFGAGHTH